MQLTVIIYAVRVCDIKLIHQWFDIYSKGLVRRTMHGL